MPKAPTPPLDPVREKDAIIIAHVVALIHARRKGDYLAAAEAHRELVRLGVLVRFPRRRKGAAR